MSLLDPVEASLQQSHTLDLHFMPFTILLLCVQMTKAEDLAIFSIYASSTMSTHDQTQYIAPDRLRPKQQ